MDRGGNDFYFVDAADDRGVLWSVPVTRIRKVRLLRSDKGWYDKIFTDDGEEMFCVHRGKRTTLSEAAFKLNGWYITPDVEAPAPD